jgi:DnaA-like protein
MSPGEGTNRKPGAAAVAGGSDLATRYRGARTRVLRPAGLAQRPSCGPACWIPELIAFNEDMRRLFLSAVPATPPSGERIRDVVAKHYGVTRIELIGASSVRRVAWPRQVAMYICARHAGLGSRDIAALFGDRDPSTVRFAVRAVAKRRRHRPALADDIAMLIAKCGLGGST